MTIERMKGKPKEGTIAAYGKIAALLEEGRVLTLKDCRQILSQHGMSARNDIFTQIMRGRFTEITTVPVNMQVYKGVCIVGHKEIDESNTNMHAVKNKIDKLRRKKLNN